MSDFEPTFVGSFPSFPDESPLSPVLELLLAAEVAALEEEPDDKGKSEARVLPLVLVVVMPLTLLTVDDIVVVGPRAGHWSTLRGKAD